MSGNDRGDGDDARLQCHTKQLGGSARRYDCYKDAAMNDLIGEDQTGILVACAVLAVPFMNDPKKADAQTNGAINPPGNVIVNAQ
jgi:hypothetical protein